MSRKSRRVLGEKPVRALRRGFKIKDEYGYTLNNSYTAYIARHIMDRREDWKELFETRRLKDDHE